MKAVRGLGPDDPLPREARIAAAVMRPRFGMGLSVLMAVLPVSAIAALFWALSATEAPWFVLLGLVVLIALLLGTIPASVAIGLSAVAVALAGGDPAQSWAPTTARWIAAGVFVLTASGLVWIVAALRATLLRLDAMLAEQGRDRAQLAERSAFLTSVLASSTDCIKVLDLTGALTFMSEGGQRVMEVSDFNAIAGCPWPDFWQGSGQADALAAIAAAREGRSAGFIGEAATMAGRLRWWHVAVSPIAGADGQVERILSVSRDITALRESEETTGYYARLIENSSDFIGMARVNGRVFFLNPAGCRLVGLDATAVTSVRMGDFCTPEQRAEFEEVIIPAVRRDGSWSGERLLRHFVTGEPIPVLSTMFPVRDSGGRLIGYGTVIRDFRERKAAEERQAIVNGEIAHRLKNTLAMVQSIATMTLRRTLPPDELARFDERLQALACSHDLLHRSSWHATDLEELARGVLDNLGLLPCCHLSGPAVRLGARAAMPTALLLHELATNALKHGALSQAGGEVDLGWRRESEGDELVLDWVERGGPAVSAPRGRGFGSRLVSMGLLGKGGTTLDWAPSGLHASFRAELAEIEG